MDVEKNMRDQARSVRIGRAVRDLARTEGVIIARVAIGDLNETGPYSAMTTAATPNTGSINLAEVTRALGEAHTRQFIAMTSAQGDETRMIVRGTYEEGRCSAWFEEFHDDSHLRDKDQSEGRES